MRRATTLTTGVTGRLGLLAILAMFGLGACAPQAANDSSGLIAQSARWDEALNSGNLDQLVALYTPDCRLLVPNAPMASGSEAVKAEFGKMVAAGLTGKLDTVETTVAGDVGYHLGTYSVFAPDGTTVDRGKFIEVWRKTAVGWQIADDIWNSDLPEGAATTYVSITLEVKDKNRWLAAWSGPNSRKAMFAEHGVGNVRVFESPDDPKRVGLLVEVKDMEAFMAFTTSAATQAAKAEDGVIERTLRLMTEVR